VANLRVGDEEHNHHLGRGHRRPATLALERLMSLSRFVSELLRGRPRQARAYEAAYRGWRAEKPLELKGTYPTRDALYDRPVLRRR